MPGIKQLTYDGEKVLYSLTRSSLSGVEEIAATNARIIYSNGRSFYDIGYDALISIGCYTIYDFKWVIAALCSSILAMALLGASAFLPLDLYNIDISALIEYITFTGTLILIVSLLLLGIFLSRIKKGVIMKTPAGTYVFRYRRAQYDKAIEFTRIVRAAKARDTGDSEAINAPQMRVQAS